MAKASFEKLLSFADIGRVPDMQKLVEAARQSPKGVERAELTPGRIIMMSANTATGDRSWTDEIWTIVGVSGPHLALSPLVPRPIYSDRPIFVSSIEHEFYDAQEMAAAVMAERAKAGAA